MEMTTHWHVADGLSGYGPDGSDGYATATTWRELADLLAGEFRHMSEYLADTAHAAADAGDEVQAWRLHREADAADGMSGTFNDSRADAPLYADDLDAWEAEIQRLAGEHFPYRYEYTVGPEGSARLALYAWPCGDPGCEHLAEED